jgi:hypothetical protein
MRREINLPQSDVDAIEQLASNWETAAVSGAPWLLVHDYQLPNGYNVRAATLAVRLAGYPQGALDMVYFHPPLARADGRAIAATTPLVIDGKTFQQWSRHYSWKAGYDSLARHLRRVGAWLSRELSK